MAELRKIAAGMYRLSSGEMTERMYMQLRGAARPLLPRVRAAILNIATHGPKHTGLRGRIARTAEAWAWARNDYISIGVAIQPNKMPSGQKALPLYMEGAKFPWRHPVYGDRDVWVTQEPHPYFEQATDWYGPAARLALAKAEAEIARILNG